MAVEATERRTSTSDGVPARETIRTRSVWLARLESPLAAYYLVFGATLALMTLGLVMVLSSSSVTSLRYTGSSYSVFTRQAVFAAIGLPLAWLATRLPVRAWKRAAWPMLGVSLLGLLLVLSPIGRGTGGNRNWIYVAGFTLQPSEAAKLGLVVWGAAVLARKRPLLGHVRHLFVPVAPVGIVMLTLVLAGNDLGTALVLIGLLGGLLFAAGAPLRIFAVAGAIATGAVGLLVGTSANRMHRVHSWLDGAPGPADYLGNGWQATHGEWALASGGWWGVGLGASREKWSWLPAAHNDFIFAIIGEELGLIGTLVVLVLFGLLGIGLFRLVLASDDLFVKVATGGVLVWVLGQAVVNVGAVVGLLPIIGLPLPLVSSGGSALVMTLVALGMVLGFARRLPGAPEALASRPGVVRRSLAVLPRAGGGR